MIKISGKKDLRNRVSEIFSKQNGKSSLKFSGKCFYFPERHRAEKNQGVGIVRLLEDHSIFEQQVGYFFAQSKFSKR